MKYTLLLIISIFCLTSGYAQTYNEEPRITQMVSAHIQSNRAKMEMPGWRVQIIATRDRAKVEKVRMEFMSRFPDIQSDWEYTEPYYKLRAGAFQSKLDAARLLNTIKEEYPSAYLTKAKKIPTRNFIYGY